MALSKKLEKLLEPFLTLSKTYSILVYDTKGIIHFANTVMCQNTGYGEAAIKGMSVFDIFTPRIGASPEDLRNYLIGKTTNKGYGVPALILPAMRFEDAIFRVTSEERNALAVILSVKKLDSRFFMAFLHFASYNISRKMGLLSPDFMAVLDEKNRVIAANEGFITFSNVPHTTVFNKPFKSFFKSKSFDVAQARYRKAQKNFLSVVNRSRNPWKCIYQENFNIREWKRVWTSDRETKLEKRSHSLRLTSQDDSGFLLFKRPFDHTKHDIKWEVIFENESRIALSFFFNGNVDLTKVFQSSPDFQGYSIGLYRSQQTQEFFVRIKRWGKILIQKNVPRLKVNKKNRLTGEKMGGGFRLSLNGKALLEFVDPRFMDYSPYRFSGLVLSSYPLIIHSIKLYRRPCGVDYTKFTTTPFDLVFKEHPDQIFEAEFFKHQLGREKVNHVFMRRVTQLRKTQRLNRQLLIKKEKSLNQINNELQIAASVLNRLLPREFPKIDGVRFCSYYHPSGHVGGDLFDVFKADENQIAILMYDVCGHGVPAALVSVMTRTLFQKHFSSRRRLIEQLKLINSDLLRDISATTFVTLFFGLLNPKKRSIRYIGAGFTPPLIVKKEGITLLNTRGVPLGLKKNMLLKEWKMPLGTSKLILYTDGLYEITNREGEFYSHPRLVNFISSHRHLPLKDLVDTIVKEHTDFVKSLPALDDVSILGIELE